MDNITIQNFMKENERLFWYIKKEEIKNISIDFLVETILCYGNERSVKKLFDLIGLQETSKIFFKQISYKRNNYHPRTIQYFKLYFQKHV